VPTLILALQGRGPSVGDGKAMNNNPRNPMAMWIRCSPVALLMWYIIYLFAHSFYSWVYAWRAR